MKIGLLVQGQKNSLFHAVARAVVLLSALLTCGAGPTPAPIPPWDFGMLLDSAMLGVILNLCFALWIPHSILLSTATFLRGVSNLLMGQIFTVVLNIMITTIVNTGIPQTLLVIALLLCGLGMVMAYTEMFRSTSLPKVLMYGAFAAALFTGGPTTLRAIDSFRTTVASTMYGAVYNSVAGSISGLPGSGTSEDWASFGGVQDHYGDGLSAHDIAMSALWLGDYDEFSPLPPQGFVEVFFPDGTDLSTVTNSSERQDAIRRGTFGALRLLMTYPISLAAVQESGVVLVFSVASFVLLTSLPIAVMFSFFAQTESIPMSVLRQYLNLVVSYLVVNTILAIVVAVMMSAAGNGNAVIAAASGLASMFVYRFAWDVAVNAAKPAFTSLTGAIAQTVGVAEPIGAIGAEIKGAMGNAVGLAGAGLAVAAGAPTLAPALFGAGKSLAEGGEGEEQPKTSLLQAGMGFLGGQMMKGTALGDVATTLTTLKSFGGAQGLTGMAEHLAPEDAVLAGLQSGSNPVAMMMALDRAHMRRERMERRYEEGDFPPAAPARTAATQPAMDDLPSSPWRGAIEHAVEKYGAQWGAQTVQAVYSVVEQMRASGKLPGEVTAEFTDSDGKPTMQSRGGRAVFDALPNEIRVVLVNADARAGLNGMIGQVVMPRIGISKAQLTDAITFARTEIEKLAAQGVEVGIGAGAGIVAERLGVEPRALGSTMGMVDAVARDQTLTMDQVEAMLPDGIRVVATSEDMARAAAMSAPTEPLSAAPTTPASPRPKNWVSLLKDDPAGPLGPLQPPEPPAPAPWEQEQQP